MSIIFQSRGCFCWGVQRQERPRIAIWLLIDFPCFLTAGTWPRRVTYGELMGKFGMEHDGTVKQLRLCKGAWQVGNSLINSTILNHYVHSAFNLSNWPHWPKCHRCDLLWYFCHDASRLWVTGICLTRSFGTWWALQIDGFKVHMQAVQYVNTKRESICYM
jgi:hypothetical protein